MALSNSTQELLRTQYYDDYYASSETAPTLGEEHDFLRILFRPRFAVQSRELTQLQTLLQAQLERLGKSQFKDGEAVLGGGLTLDTSVTSGQVIPQTNLVALFDRTTNDGHYIFDTTDETIKAHILQFSSPDEGETTNSYILFKQQTGSPFLPGAVVQDADDPTISATFVTGTAADVFSVASVVSIDEGVFFVSGFFVRVAKQTIVLNTFSDRPTFRIGLEIAEQVLDELDDVVGDSLLDPANSNAPGAHRFRLRLTLAKRTLTTTADAGFIELARVVDGQILQSKKTPKFVRVDELNTILARRTYDESGDYLTKHFTPVIDVNPADDTTFLLNLGPGKAYVRGYEIETTQTTKEVINKGRVTQVANNRSIPVPVGNFIYVSRISATEPTNYFSNTAIVDIHCVNVASLLVSSQATYDRSRIGQAKIRMVEPGDIPSNSSYFANNTTYKLFFYDVVGDTFTGTVVDAAVNNAVAIDVVLAIANGTPAVNGAIEGVTIVLSGANSPVTGTFTVNNYVVAGNGTHAFATLKEFLPTLPTTATSYKLIFQAKDIDAFATFDSGVTTINSPYKANLAFQADIHIDSKVNGGPTGATFVSDTNDNVLLYEIPETFVKANTISTDTATFKSWLTTSSNAQAFSANSNTEFTVTVSGANFSLPEGALSATTAAESFVIFDQTNDISGHGIVVQFMDAPGAADRSVSNVTVTPVGADYNVTFWYHFGANTSTTRSLVGLAKAVVAGYPVRQKTFITANTSNVRTSSVTALDAGQIEFYSLNAAAGFAYSLKTTDVFRIHQVLYKSSNVAFDNTDLSTAVDVTDLFSLDTGQRDNTYEYASLIVGSGASATIQPTGRLLVFFDWFKNSGRGYATVDSYVNAPNAAKGMTYDLVPDYTSAKFNHTVNLRDALDFRPMRSHAEFAAAALIFASNDASTNTTYLTSAAESYLIPVSDDIWFGDYEFYLSRIDKIGLAYDGTFRTLSGVDSIAPKAPEDESGMLLLFQLTVPPYTKVDANGVPTSVLLTTFDHKRYTMQDISKMDDRVSHLQYYTMLNSLETLTKNASILDGDQNERFKNGIVVDAFHGSETADVARPDFTAALDTTAGELRTAFRHFVTQFAPDIANATGYGISLVGDMAIPTYGTTPFITQPLATRAVSVNPFDVASFYGTMRLSPAVDIWKDVDSKPAQVVDLGGPTKTWLDSDLPSYTNWGEWDQTFSGVTAVTPRNQFFTPPGWTPDNHEWGSMSQLSWNDVTTATMYQRQGTQFEFNVTSTTASLGNKVVDVSVVHNIRNRDVVFAADGLKPGASIFAFFDGEAVTPYVQQANILRLEEQAVGVVPFYLGQTVYVRKALTGTVATLSGNNQITGTGTAFLFELVAGQLVRVTQGVQTYDSFVSSVSSDGTATLTVTAGITLAAATLYTLTPVTVADIATRLSGSVVQYTIKVVRAIRDSASDSAVPYALTPGSLRPEKMVGDLANTTTGAVVIVPASPMKSAASLNVVGAVCHSGMVRSYDAGTAALRFDTDITDAAVATPGTVIYFVAGPGAGTSATVLSYNAAIQTAILDDSALAITPQTIYSVGALVGDGFVVGDVTIGHAGTVAGVFHIPNAAFAVGTRLFRLTDEPNNLVANATSTAETNYVASGISYTQQEISVSSRALSLVRGGPQTETRTVVDTTIQGFAQQYIDPLAETFLVDAVSYPQGVFITSVDVCFKAKPADDIPIVLEVRPVVNGYPSSNQLVPCVSAGNRASVSLRPDSVKVSDTPSFSDANTVTTFTLAAPVHLMPGQEFAIVLRSDSNLYTLYTAELGNSIIGSDAKVAKQPYAGSFFKSQNASAWTESPFEDLMFRINRALWTANTSSPQVGVMVARGIATAANASFDSYEFYPHDVTFGNLTGATYVFDVKPMNQTTQDLTGAVAVRYVVEPDTWSLLTTRAMLQGFGVAAHPLPVFASALIPASNTIDALCTLSTNSPDVAPYIDVQKINMLCVRHLINDMVLANTGVIVIDPGAGYMANLQPGTLNTTGGSLIVTGNLTTANFSATLLPGDTVVVGGNLEIVVASVTNSSHFLATANVSVTRAANVYYTYSAMDGTGNVALTIADGNGSSANGVARVGRNGKITGVTLDANGSGYTGTPTLVVVAPDAPGGAYTVAQANGVLGYNSELAATGGNGLTRYVTRPVTLADGFDAQDIRVTFDAYRPAGSHFYVYVAALAGDDDTGRIQDQPWRLLTMETPDSVVSTGYHQFKEFNFVTATGRVFDAAADTTDRFKVFAVKIVVASSNTVDVPRLANFRAIALDT